MDKFEDVFSVLKSCVLGASALSFFALRLFREELDIKTGSRNRGRI